MIGKEVRGLRHLFRLASSAPIKALIEFKESKRDICLILKSPSSSVLGESLFIFNRCLSTLGDNMISTARSVFKNCSEVSNYPRAIEVPKTFGELRPYEDLICSITLLPESFEEDYAAFLKENAKMVNALRSKFGADFNEATFKMLYLLSNGSKHFFQWAVPLYCNSIVSMNMLKNIFIWNECYGQLTSKLSKGTITAYKTKVAILELISELRALRKEKRINDAINSFNTVQKKLIKSTDLSDVDKETLSKFSRLSEAKRLNFIKKVSTIDSFDELMRQMRHVTSMHFNWNKESLMDFLNNVDGVSYEKVFEHGNVVLLKVNDYETIKQLAKTTNWCISKNKTYWNNYVERHNGKATQFVIFDFSKIEDDKYSIIGFTTTKNKGITSAHDFTNQNLMECNDNDNAITLIKSYLARFKKSNSIWGIINALGIDISHIMEYDKSPYKWSKDGVMKYLYECVNKETVDILMSKNDKLILSVRNEDIRYFFGEAYINNIPSDYWGEQHVLFIDFSKRDCDPNRIHFAIITGSSLYEDSCIGMFDATSSRCQLSFNAKLADFGAPYDIIRRKNNLINVAKEAFTFYNLPLLKSCIEKDEKLLPNLFHNELSQDDIHQIIKSTIVDYLSFDYLNLIYDSNLTLSNVIGSGYTSELMKSLIQLFIYNGRELYGNDEFGAIGEKEINDFYNEKIENRTFVLYVGIYLAIKMIIDKEIGEDVDYKRIYGRLFSNIFNKGVNGEPIKDLMCTAVKRVPLDTSCDAIRFFIKYAIIKGDDEMKEIAKTMAEKSKPCKKEFDSTIAEMSCSSRLAEVFCTSSVAASRVDVSNATYNAANPFNYEMPNYEAFNIVGATRNLNDWNIQTRDGRG